MLVCERAKALLQTNSVLEGLRAQQSATFRQKQGLVVFAQAHATSDGALAPD